MKHIALLFIFGSIFLKAFPQDMDLQLKLDSIIMEADLMYRYEKSVWNSSDLLMKESKLKNNIGGYVVSHSGDSVFVTYLNKGQKKSIARYTYVSTNLYRPYLVSLETSSLTDLEMDLRDVKHKMINQLSDSKYNVEFPQEFNPNFVLIKAKKTYKLYVIMGTSESGIVPFGNDNLFRSDANGTITEWIKFHSRMIAAPSKGPNGEKVISPMHSHLKTTPYITATDICTFRLYGLFCDMEEFMVFCSVTSKLYKYSLKTNKIEVIEK